MSEPFHVVAVISPVEGKVDRVRELLKDMTVQVKEKEPNTSRYHLHEEIEKNPPELVMIETYKSKADVDAHMKTPYFQNLVKSLTEEELVSKAPVIVTCKSVAGFESR